MAKTATVKTKQRTRKVASPDSAEVPAKMGRKRIELDFNLFEGLCRIFCTLSEIAGVLGVSEDTVERRCKEQYGQNFADIHKRFSSAGRMSLRRTQLKVAEAGNPTMLIWMGKQFLAQVDKQELSGPGGESITQPIANAIDKIYGKTE